MTLRYNLTGADRKRLVTAISEITGAPAKYLGAPSFAYQVDYFTIDRNGGVTFDGRADSEDNRKPHRHAGQPGLHSRAASGRSIRAMQSRPPPEWTGCASPCQPVCSPRRRCRT